MILRCSMATPKTNPCLNCDTRADGVFCDLPEEQLDEMGRSKTSNLYHEKQMLFYEGNKPYGLYCIRSGKVKLYKMSLDGHQKIVRIAGPGDILGYRCLLANEPYAATAETLEKADICFIDKNTFDNILEKNPKTARNVMSVLANDLKKAEDDNFSMVHKSVRERLAELLLLFKKRFGTKEGNNFSLQISLSRQEMAECIGTTPETVIRTLSEFKKEGLIIEKDHVLVLPNLAKLAIAARIED